MTIDDDLLKFAEQGAAPLPAAASEGTVDHAGASIWYATYGTGAPVILLHGGLGHSGNWGYQVPALIGAGYRAILIDTRGHGRSTRDQQPFKYELLASDVLAVIDALRLDKAAIVGWSDGACTALITAMMTPMRVSGVFFFGCNMDPSGTRTITEPDPVIGRCFVRHITDYAALSATPDDFKAFAAAVDLMMKSEPNYSARDLSTVSVPVTIVQAEHDQFIRREHAEYLARSIPGSEFLLLPGMSHFAPLQRPREFNGAMLAFLGKTAP